MKKIIISLIFMISTTLLLFSLPPIELGVGGFFMPGQYNFTLIGLYTREMNDQGIETLDEGEIQPINYIGLNINGSVELYGFVLKPQFTLAIPTKTTITYTDTSTGTTVPHTIEHKALLLTGCPWIGPIIHMGEKNSVYLLIGPYLIYSEWRDKETVGDNEPTSKDRQYFGFGITFPLLIGVEKLMTDHIGISLEGIVSGQQILIKSYGKDSLAASQQTWDILPFPTGTFYNPLTLILQFSVVYRFR